MKKSYSNHSRGLVTGLLMFALLTVFVIAARVDKAGAYFTTYATAKGGYPIKLGDTTTIHDDYVGGYKVINIENTGDYNAVWVRVKAITGEEYESLLDYSERDSNWSDADGDGWYRFKKPLGPGEATGSFVDSQNYNGFVINVKEVLEQDLPEGTNINVDVVYETVPVRYNADGSAEDWTEADWSGSVIVNRETEDN